MRIRGSLTLYATISIMLVAQLLFTLLEAARYTELKKVAAMSSNSSIESLFAEYCIPLWETYHILGMDAGNPSGKVDFRYEKNQLTKWTQETFAVKDSTIWANQANLLRLSLLEVTPNSYSLITDGGGAIFEKQISSYMKNNLAYETAKLIYNDYESVDAITKENEVDNKGIAEAQKAIKQAANSGNKAKTANKRGTASSSNKQNGNAKTNIGISSGAKIDNPLDAVEKNQKKGILSVVLGDEALSDKTIDLTDSVAKRKKETGLKPEVFKTSWYDDALLEEYILGNMSYFGLGNNDRALSYEVEYIISGKSSDKENLKGVVNKILMIREATNMAYLVTSPSKQSEVMALATSLGAATLNPAIIEAIKYGIMAGWAYCESILDLRALLAGDKIPLIKSDANWTSGLSSIASLLSGNSKAKTAKTGISYREYLGIILLSEGRENKCYRTMDIQERTIRQVKGYENYRMDNIICSLSVEMKYSYYTVFSSLVNLGNISSNHFYISNNTNYSYYK